MAAVQSLLLIGLTVVATAAAAAAQQQDISASVAQSLMTILAEEKRLRSSLESELITIGSEIGSLQASINNATCACPGRRPVIAFSAALNTDITNLGTNQQIPFKQIISNIGNAYDARHGEFRAPVTGTYEFAVSMLMSAGHWAGVEIVKNGVSIAKVRTGDNSYYSMASNVVTVNLQAGDDVWVEHIAEGDSNVIYGQQFSSFSGHLL